MSPEHIMCKLDAGAFHISCYLLASSLDHSSASLHRAQRGGWDGEYYRAQTKKETGDSEFFFRNWGYLETEFTRGAGERVWL